MLKYHVSYTQLIASLVTLTSSYSGEKQEPDSSAEQDFYFFASQMSFLKVV